MEDKKYIRDHNLNFYCYESNDGVTIQKLYLPGVSEPVREITDLQIRVCDLEKLGWRVPSTASIKIHEKNMEIDRLQKEVIELLKDKKD